VIHWEIKMEDGDTFNTLHATKSARKILGKDLEVIEFNLLI
jgi:hypothetical protein